MMYDPIAEVIIDVPARAIDRPFDYLIPPELREEVQVGSRVQVPFGTRKRIGYVVTIKSDSTYEHHSLKSILDVMDFLPPLTPELIRIGQMMAREYLCPLITALQSMIPAVFKGIYKKYAVAFSEPNSLGKQAEEIYTYVQQRHKVEWEELQSIFTQPRRFWRRLVDEEVLKIHEKMDDRITKRKITWVTVPDWGQLKQALSSLSNRAKKQQAVLRHLLKEQQSMPLAELMQVTKADRNTVKRLVEKEWITWEEKEEYRDPYAGKHFSSSEPLPLTREQEQAFNAIMEAMQSETLETILLQGVTGSGKTEVYLQSIERALQAGKQTIVLVPEISLTPQMVERFKGRFGSQVAVLHSRLSAGERYDEWRRIRTGKVQIAIGARSAIFAPFTKLGLIIIDEEHESSYKQEESPKYHARDVAHWRAKEHQATVILGSATPSVESYYYARTGQFHWVTLWKRVNNRPFPQMQVVDMREELKQGNRSMFSKPLQQALLDRIQKKEQSVLFLNRRGFSTFVMCRACGESLLCPHCDISLTYHQTNQTTRCHYCGYAEHLPSLCPHCQSKHIRHFGTGTQKVEEELIRQFPEIRVIRMDVDTTRKKGAHERLLSAFARGEADVLLGTQMIAKGLDFPRVTLVGVIAADTTLHLPDFRATERTFQLLTQVGGRAGRHEHPGEVVVQTYNVDHYSIEMASTYQSEEFYRKEAGLRKRHLYPPFCGLFTLLISHPDRTFLLRETSFIAQKLTPTKEAGYQLLGPVPAPIPKLKDLYRMQIVIKSSLQKESIDQVKRGLQLIQPTDKQLRIQIDRDGGIAY